VLRLYVPNDYKKEKRKKMKVPLKTKEHAYTRWRESGQNISETHRLLKKDGYNISRKVLFDWRASCHWEVRAARAEAEEKERKNASTDEVLLSCLISEKQRLEAYLKSLPEGEVNVNATREYNKILKDIKETRDRISNKLETPVSLTDPNAIVESLWSSISLKLAGLRNPDQCTSENIKDINAAMEAITKIMEKFAPEEKEEEEKEVTETAKNRIKAIYGLEI